MYCLDMADILLLRQKLALQNLLDLLRDVLRHGRKGSAQAAVLVLESGMLAVDGLEGLHAFESWEVLVWEVVSTCITSSPCRCASPKSLGENKTVDLLRLM